MYDPPIKNKSTEIRDNLGRQVKIKYEMLYNIMPTPTINNNIYYKLESDIKENIWDMIVNSILDQLEIDAIYK
jgi:hypothetical protein